MRFAYPVLQCRKLDGRQSFQFSHLYSVKICVNCKETRKLTSIIQSPKSTATHSTNISFIRSTLSFISSTSLLFIIGFPSINYSTAHHHHHSQSSTHQHHSRSSEAHCYRTRSITNKILTW